MKALGPEAIIWDMDGTLVDTAQHHFSAWRNAAQSAGREFSTEDFAKTFGRRNPDVIAYLFGESISGSAGEQLAHRKEEEYRAEVMRHGVDLLPGARKILDAFHAAGYRQAIGTSAPRANLEQILLQTRIATLFQVTITGQDTVNGKPNPEVFLKAARSLGVTPARCLVFEDAEAGVLAAKSAGMKCVGVCTGGHSSAAELRAAGADLVIKNLESIDLAAVEAL